MTISTQMETSLLPWEAEEEMEPLPGATKCQEISFFAGKVIAQWGKVAMTAFSLHAGLIFHLSLYQNMHWLDALDFTLEQNLNCYSGGLAVYCIGKILEGFGNFRKELPTSHEERPESPRQDSACPEPRRPKWTRYG